MERRDKISTAAGALYMTGLVSGEIIGGSTGASAIINPLNNESIYSPIHDKIEHLQHENSAIAAIEGSQALRGYGGRVATEAHLSHRSDANNAEIKTLQASEPKQIPAAESGGIIIAMSMVGMVAGVAVAHTMRKSASAVKDRLSKPKTA